MLRKLEKYEVQEEIGHGGMATVYRAHDTVLDRMVALKVMHPHLRAAEEARRRFHREAQSVARLRHPRVLEIYDFSGEGSDEAYIAAELLTGPTLKRWREDTQEVPAEIAACFVIEIAKALEAAHEAKIIHRDVKPENVLLHQARTIKLTDFGIADMIDAASMTATGQILGSPGHMAPEQIEGKDTDTRTDLFSLGTVLYYLATGRLPFTGRNPHQVLKRIVDAEYADPLRVNPTIGGRLRSIIIKTLEKDPDERYQTAVEVREDLESFVAEAGIEDAEVTLAAYLQDAETVGAELRDSTIEHLIERGSRASDAGDVPSALDCYNRVLALDEGNERVLKLIERVGLDRRKRAAMMSGAGLFAFGLVACGVAYAVWTQPPEPVPSPDPTPVADVAVDAGEVVATAERPDAMADEPDAAVEPVVAAAGPEDAGRAVVARPRLRRVRLIERGLIDVSVDGALREGHVELRPGPHVFTLTPSADMPPDVRRRYQQTTTRRIQIPRGSGDFDVELIMRLNPGALTVDCGVVGAEVVITTGAGSVRGHCDEVLAVPMPSVRTVPSIVVTAPGRAAHRVPNPPNLTAGAATRQVRVTLPSEGTAAP